jgi:hypothetical protein
MTPSNDPRLRWLVLALLALVYLYFFQGGGWNQNARLDTTRAIVERHSLNIAPYASNTGDLSSKDGQVLIANKPPTFSLLGVPLYAFLYVFFRVLSLDPGDWRVMNASAHVLSWFLSGLPAVAIAWLLSRHFQRTGLSVRKAYFAAIAFALGSIVFPYTGALLPHIFVGAALLGAWTLLQTSDCPAPQNSDFPLKNTLLSGLLAGTAVACDYSVMPLLGLFFLRGLSLRGLRGFAEILVGPAAWALVLAGCNYASFGQFLVTNNTYQIAAFSEKGLFLGMFQRPQPMVLYWLTFEPRRGLFYCNPVMLLGLLGVVALAWQSVRQTLQKQRQSTPSPRAPHVAIITFLRSGRCWTQFVPMLVIGYLLLVNLCFNGWAGGWGVGPRYLTPALPFLFLYASVFFQRLPRFSLAISLLSIVLMLCVTSVLLSWPMTLTGPPRDITPSPVVESIKKLGKNEVSICRQGVWDIFPAEADSTRPRDFWASYNLGEVAGLRGVWSLVPVVLLLVALGAAIAKLPDDEPAVSRLNEPRP